MVGGGRGWVEHSDRGWYSLNLPPIALQGTTPRLSYWLIGHKSNKDWQGLRPLRSQTSKMESNPNTSVRV